MHKVGITPPSLLPSSSSLLHHHHPHSYRPSLHQSPEEKKKVLVNPSKPLPNTTMDAIENKLEGEAAQDVMGGGGGGNQNEQQGGGEGGALGGLENAGTFCCC